MSGEIATAFVAIRPSGSAASFQSEVEGVTKPAISSLAKGLASLGVGVGVAAALKASFDQLKSEQEVAAITTARLAATGGQAGVTKQQIDDLAQSLQDLSGRNRDEIQSGENVLLSFSAIRDQAGKNNDIFTQTVKLSTDLAVALGESVPQAAENLGKALQNPANAGRALRSANVILTKSQTDLIKSMVSEGDTLDAQKYILQQVRDQVGGAAAAYGNTLPGQLDKAKASLLELGASILQTAAPAISAIVSVGSGAINLFESMPAPLRTAVVVLGAAAVATNVFDLSLDQLVFNAVDAAGAVDGLVASLTAEASSAQVAGAALAGAAVGYTIIQQGVKKVDDAQAKLEAQDTAVILSKKYDQLGHSISAVSSVIDSLRADRNDTLNPFSAIADSKALDAADKALALMQRLKSQTDALAGSTNTSKDSVLSWLQAQQRAGVTYDSNNQAVEAYRQHIEQTTEKEYGWQSSVDAVTKAITDQENAVKAQLDPLFAAQQALDTVATSQENVVKAIHDYGINSPEAHAANLQLAQDGEKAYLALLDVKKGLDNGKISAQQAQAQLQQMTQLGLIPSSGAAHDVADQLYGIINQASKLPGTKRIDIETNAADVEQIVQRLASQLAQVAAGVRGAGIGTGGLRASATGSTLGPHQVSQVNDAGIESFTVDGRTYLLAGSQPVRINSHGRTEAIMADQSQSGSGLVYAPTYQIYGSTPEQAIEQANRQAFFEVSMLAGVA